MPRRVLRRMTRAAGVRRGVVGFDDLIRPVRHLRAPRAARSSRTKGAAPATSAKTTRPGNRTFIAQRSSPKARTAQRVQPLRLCAQRPCSLCPSTVAQGTPSDQRCVLGSTEPPPSELWRCSTRACRWPRARSVYSPGLVKVAVDDPLVALEFRSSERDLGRTAPHDPRDGGPAAAPAVHARRRLLPRHHLPRRHRQLRPPSRPGAYHRRARRARAAGTLTGASTPPWSVGGVSCPDRLPAARAARSRLRQAVVGDRRDERRRVRDLDDSRPDRASALGGLFCLRSALVLPPPPPAPPAGSISHSACSQPNAFSRLAVDGHRPDRARA